MLLSRPPYACTLCAAARLSGGGLARSAAPRSGIAHEHVDAAVRVQDDFFRHVNDRWLQDTPIPPDKARYGAFDQIHDETQAQLRVLIEEAAARASAPADGEAVAGEARQIGNLYASFMDEAAIETLGIRPLADELAAIAAVQTPASVAPLMARLARLGVAMPLIGFVRPDAGDATRYVPYLTQEGLGLPDRDYYLNEGDARFAEVRVQYRAHLARLLALAGEPDGEATAAAIVALETELARAQWSRVDNRDQLKTYNPVAVADLPARAPGIAWPAYLAEAGYAGKTPDVILRQPDYAAALGRLIEQRPLATWRAYARARLLASYAPYLGRDFVDERFAFAVGVLRGTPQNLPRWQRGVALVDEAIGEGLGKLYVARHFPPAHQAKMVALVDHLMAAYRESIDALDWMGPETRREAQAKLASFQLKIGHPSKWLDYTALRIDRGDLVGNLMRARAFAAARGAARLGQPIDRDEWFMTPQTVNAYYNPSMNEIVFPASILKPPFFDAMADDAVNFGAIGAVIGHEISHGFDDQGSRYDAAGNLRDWWTAEDRARFAAKTQRLIAQYGAYEPVPGYPLDGALSLGENIADNSGLAIAWKAYRRSLSGRPAPVIDGQSGEQRFFFGFAQVWRAKVREAALIQQLKAGPHAPPEFRANGTVRNHPGFYATFDVQPGDGMYLPPEERVSIW